jgi:hypothetical protein
MTTHRIDGADIDARLAEPNLRLRVGEHVVDVGALKVASNPDAPRLSSKAMAVLIELVRDAGDTVTRDRFLEVVWKDRVTTPDVLTQAIKELRRALDDEARRPASRRSRKSAIASSHPCSWSKRTSPRRSPRSRLRAWAPTTRPLLRRTPRARASCTRTRGACRSRSRARRC